MAVCVRNRDYCLLDALSSPMTSRLPIRMENSNGEVGGPRESASRRVAGLARPPIHPLPPHAYPLKHRPPLTQHLRGARELTLRSHNRGIKATTHKLEYREKAARDEELGSREDLRGLRSEAGMRDG